MNNDNFDWDRLASVNATDAPQPRPAEPLEHVAPAQVVQPVTPQANQAAPAGQFEIINLDGPRTAIRSNTWGAES